MAEDHPELGEFVLGTVKEIFRQGAFVTLEEYNNTKGILHISEISLKWVRNIRDYVKEGQKVVLQILRVDKKKGYIDLSLRRVTDKQRKAKLLEVKSNQRAKKLLDLMASELELSEKDLEKISDELLKEYDSTYAGLESIAADHGIAKKLDIPLKWQTKLVELVSKSIKEPFVEITGYVKLMSYAPEGIIDIKAALKKIQDYKTDCTLDVRYIAAPLYRIHVKASKYKTAERVLRESSQECTKYMRKRGGEGEFFRKLE